LKFPPPTFRQSISSAETVKADKHPTATLDEAKKFLDYCPCPQWRLIFALCRFSGLRQQEPLLLRWGDVDWHKSRITVHSPKTAHHEGKDKRESPIFPELRPYLVEMWEAAEPGAERIITRYQLGDNLCTQMERWVEQAGLAWNKPFQNLRSTRQIELEAKYPTHKVCYWLGNSPKVAAKHYLQMRDEDFEQAAAGDSALSSALTAQNAAQTAPDTTGVTRQESYQEAKNPRKTGVLGALRPMLTTTMHQYKYPR
jgi:integrase